jgi:MFS family permease
MVNWRNLLAACAAISVFGFAVGMTYPLLSLLLEADGVSTNMIGINSAMMPVGILLFSPMLPVLSKRVGSRVVAIAAAIITALLLLAYKAFDSLEAWFIIRLVQGMSVSTLFVLSEAWIVQYAGQAHRGKVVALYAAVLSASFGAGPALVGWIGIEGWLPFVIGAAVVILSVIPLAMVQESTEDEIEETAVSGIFTFAAKAPILLAAVGIFAVFDAATLAFLPLYGLKIGLNLSTAALALTTLIVGNVILQLPIGWLADRFSKQTVLKMCALVSVIFAILLPYTGTSIWLWPVLVILGAAGYGVYTVSLADLGDRFQGNELVAGSAAFAVMWGVGALIGSISGGWAMSLFGPYGLPILVAFSYAALYTGILLRASRAK